MLHPKHYVLPLFQTKPSLLLVSDLKDSGVDLICPKQLNVLTGLVFVEGGESSLELSSVC